MIEGDEAVKKRGSLNLNKRFLNAHFRMQPRLCVSQDKSLFSLLAERGNPSRREGHLPSQPADWHAPPMDVSKWCVRQRPTLPAPGDDSGVPAVLLKPSPDRISQLGSAYGGAQERRVPGMDMAQQYRVRAATANYEPRALRSPTQTLRALSEVASNASPRHSMHGDSLYGDSLYGGSMHGSSMHGSPRHHLQLHQLQREQQQQELQLKNGGRRSDGGGSRAWTPGAGGAFASSRLVSTPALSGRGNPINGAAASASGFTPLNSARRNSWRGTARRPSAR